ncbi:pyridoxal phosphate-dependent transferase [Gilbertella persicaria]|uniref:pyridoxal phosphate-dependent transferase n=1 Tax=Gilbertella persicaria TaxID=101096 RepID=UPI00222111CE|nr:pyridoxal phosphate-dependent transferase [Gilbertella persicaria]KAI8051923.1 pyridoxal phosphate-dependent transferase [Gilbertella persicaria]
MSPLSTCLNTEKPFVYDFTSDTATIPTDEMFDIMKAASRGDDVYQTDEDCKALEDYVAELMGHEAALFCVSGTLSNQLGLRCLLFQPPHSVLCDSRSHVFNYECGGISYHSQANVVPVVARGTYMTAQEVESRINKDYLCGAPTKEIRKIHDVARANNVFMHMDGARLWNASQETKTPLIEYGKYFDTISICLSKGAGAPIGSILTGTKELITRARHIRKMMGAGWRQAGMLATAARHCINTVVPTMPETHALARKLGTSLQSLGVQILLPVETNMIFIDTSRTGLTIADFAEALKLKNIKIFSNPSTTTRLVLHYQITEKAVDDFIQVATELVQAKHKSGFIPPTHVVDVSVESAYPTATVQT